MSQISAWIRIELTLSARTLLDLCVQLPPTQWSVASMVPFPAVVSDFLTGVTRQMHDCAN